mmetsp:Transcript_22385/g.68940  ORF Transcript_22385/g.68940 Transcript_22385/m.68940 type:complete len:692 (+) Transcript_22385:106-2181(+)|eukprot:CAMPEP_0198661200 /NCGR_PEP_ID=MMETSP1467-20131203/40506_1 /TAXON_ID=1462469 /ORGANISM="unid. sp., Strain CCMP2135" /LENGTH=691 /DNA_ID=CAMNT_0044397627 /DNA_START=69 /DNA_END=2144 /DNA_ORIENTATION=-
MATCKWIGLSTPKRRRKNSLKVSREVSIRHGRYNQCAPKRQDRDASEGVGQTVEVMGTRALLDVQDLTYENVSTSRKSGHGESLSEEQSTRHRRNLKTNTSDWMFRGTGLEAHWKEAMTQKSENASEAEGLTCSLREIRDAASLVDFDAHGMKLDRLYADVRGKLESEGGFDGLRLYKHKAMNKLLLVTQDGSSHDLCLITHETRVGSASLSFLEKKKETVIILSSWAHRDAFVHFLIVARALERARAVAHRAIFSETFIADGDRQLHEACLSDECNSMKQSDLFRGNDNDVSWQFEDFFTVGSVATTSSKQIKEDLTWRVRGCKNPRKLRLLSADGRIIDTKTRCFTYDPKRRILKSKRLECITATYSTQTVAKRRALVLSTLIAVASIAKLAPDVVMSSSPNTPPALLLLLVASLVVGCLSIAVNEFDSLWCSHNNDHFVDFKVIDDEIRLLDDGAYFPASRGLEEVQVDNNIEATAEEATEPTPTFTGRWVLDVRRSDDPSEQLKALGVPWALRHALVRSPNVKRIIYHDSIWTEESETVLLSRIQHLRLDGKMQTETHPIDGAPVHIWSSLGRPPSDAPQCSITTNDMNAVISVISYANGNVSTIARTLEDHGQTYHVVNELVITNGRTVHTDTYFRRHNDSRILDGARGVSLLAAPESESPIEEVAMCAPTVSSARPLVGDAQRLP